MVKCKYYKPEMDVLLEYCKTFYSLKDCETGGPLHILLDDNNYENHHIEFCLEECLKHPNATVAALGTIICREYLKMTMPERSVFQRHWIGWDVKCCSTCDDCELMDIDTFWI